MMKSTNLLLTVSVCLAQLTAPGLHADNCPPQLAPVMRPDAKALLESGQAADPVTGACKKAGGRLAAPKRTVSYTGFFYEDFEDMEPLQLSNGWVAVATPGLPGDTWSVATLGAGDNVVGGVSGDQYAFILGNRDSDNPVPHDAWLFSPKISLEKGVEYDVDFYT